MTISDTARPAPRRLQSWRNGRSVTPAMGATKRLLRKEKPANCMEGRANWTTARGASLPEAARLAGAPKCKLDVVLPREMTFAEGKALSQIPVDEKNTAMAWGAQFANKILVHCP